MKMVLLTVGKTDIKWVKDGLETYAARLSHYVPFSVSEIPELKGVSALSHEQIKSREGALILERVRHSDQVILLDEHGKEYSSVEFSRFVEKLTSSGRDAVFVIGGAYGFSREVYDRADGMVSLSRMTFSHQMVRAIFAEQLYRSFTILRGEPYHHE